MDGMLIGAAITCLGIQEYRAAFIFGTIGILAIMADIITMIKDNRLEKEGTTNV